MLRFPSFSRSLLIILAATAFCASPQQHARADEKPIVDKSKKPSAAKALVGVWKMTAIERGGQKTAPPLEMTFAFDGKKVEQKAAGRATKSDYKLNAKKSQYLDIVRKRGDQEIVFKMLFKIDGDTLTICSGRPTAERPTEFTSKNGYSLQVLKRSK